MTPGCGADPRTVDPAAGGLGGLNDSHLPALKAPIAQTAGEQLIEETAALGRGESVENTDKTGGV